MVQESKIKSGFFGIFSQ